MKIAEWPHVSDTVCITIYPQDPGEQGSNRVIFHEFDVGQVFLKTAPPNLLDLCLLIPSATETELPTPCSPLRADNFWSGL